MMIYIVYVEGMFLIRLYFQIFFFGKNIFELIFLVLVKVKDKLLDFQWLKLVVYSGILKDKVVVFIV